jgi:hypothetical protein
MEDRDMSKSRIRGLTPTLPDGYTSEPTHLRIFREETGDQWPWHVDAADDAGNYTEVVGRFATHDAAVTTMPQFIDEVTACYSPQWRWLRHGVHYISADGPEPDATWSVYREEYAVGSPDEPIPGTTRRISTHPTEATANAEASRLQRRES